MWPNDSLYSPERTAVFSLMVCVLPHQVHGAQHSGSGPAVGSAGPAVHEDAAQPGAADRGQVGLQSTLSYFSHLCYGFCLRRKPTELALSLILFLCLFMSLWPFHLYFGPSRNSPNNSTLSCSLLPVLFLPYWSFQLYISLWKSPSALM